MPSKSIVRSCEVKRSARVIQMESIFDVPPSQRSENKWEVNIPCEGAPWNIGLIVGPSGCGKSTIARELFGKDLIGGYDWPSDQSILDAFPKDMGVKDITSILGSVGFSSPPSWVRPFGVLSNGEQFRVTVARALAENTELAVIDEFTSVVDRTVAKIGSCAVAKAVRLRGQRLIAVACHYDIIDWLQPDWIYYPATGEFERRSLRRRPPIELEVIRVKKSAWELFKRHHYLSEKLLSCAKCWVGLIDGQPAVFASAVPRVGHNGAWREHRTVCLPDYQGAGIGNAFSNYIASVMKSKSGIFRSVTSNPAMITSRLRSELWEASEKTRPYLVRSKHAGLQGMSLSFCRSTWSFRYIGPANPDHFKKFMV